MYFILLFIQLFGVSNDDGLPDKGSSVAGPMMTSTVNRMRDDTKFERAVLLGLTPKHLCSFEANQSYPKMNRLEFDERPSIDCFEGSSSHVLHRMLFLSKVCVCRHAVGLTNNL